jgi:hypothetical protein
MAKTMRVRNKSPLEKYVIRQGTKITFGAFEERVMVDDLAKEFMKKFPNDVEKIPEEDFGAVAQPMTKSGSVWLANVTGDPDGPDTLQVKERLPKGWATKGSPFFEASIKNPAKDPSTLKYTIGGSQVEYVNESGGLSAWNKPSQVISIPPFRRVELGQYIAEWLLNREAGSAIPGVIGEYPRRVILSRPPNKFEPNLNWELFDLSEYLKLIDSEAPVEESEAKIRSRFKKRTESEIQVEIETIKRKVMKRLYFRLVNPKYILPSEDEWNDYIAGLKEPKKEEAIPIVEDNIANEIADRIE